MGERTEQRNDAKLKKNETNATKFYAYEKRCKK